MKIIILATIFLILSFKSFDLKLLEVTVWKDFYSFDLISISLGEPDNCWNGSVFFIMLEDGVFQWDLFFLNSKTSAQETEEYLNRDI